MGDTTDPALAELCKNEYPRLVGLLALYVGSRPVAEDLAQETLIRLHQHWPRVQAMASPHAWLCRVGINLARSWWRRHFAEQRANRRAHDDSAGDALEHADVLAVRAAVAALVPRQRAALVLRFYGGLTVTETAETLGCAPGTASPSPTGPSSPSGRPSTSTSPPSS